MIRDDGNNQRLSNFKYKCIICGKKFKGFGNNAEPLAKGICCNKCNALVINERLKLIKMKGGKK
jgi:DNA-directed RNA polymerase subunit RPC12/RpoP